MIEANSVTQALWDVLLSKSRVYRLSEPDRVLRQKEIHWDRQTCDVEDEDGKVYYDVPWDDLEFWDDVEYHIPDED